MVQKLAKVLVGALLLFIGIPFVAAFSIPFFVDETPSYETEQREDSIKDGLFYHAKSGWRFKIPAGWELQSEEERQMRHAASQEAVKGLVEERRVSRAPGGQLALLKSTGDNFVFQYQEVDPQKTTGLLEKLINISKASFGRMAKQNGMRVQSTKSEKMIGTKKFTFAEFAIVNSAEQVVMKNLSYLHLEGQNNLLLMSSNCQSPDACQEITQAVEGSQFSE